MIAFSQLLEQKNSQAHNLYRLFVLRNLLIVAFLLLFAYLSYDDSAFPLAYLGYIPGALLVFNIFTGWWLCSNKTVTDNTLIWQLVIDVAAFTGVLYLTGGASNPFGWFYLVPVFIVATLVPGRAVWLITGLSIIGYTALLFFYLPVSVTPAHGEYMQHTADFREHTTGFHQHIIGMWLGYMMTAVLVAYVVARMAISLRERDQYLAQARESALRDERLVALGTLAAGTAHELGTPLSTIAIIIREMQLSSHSAENTEQLSEMLPVRQFISNVTEQWQQQRPSTRLVLDSDVEKLNSQILAEQTLSQAIINILNNAADASPETINLQVEQSGEQVIISVMDQGLGLDSMVQAHAGKQTYSSKKQGLGLGLFLAYASIERLGGEIRLTNRQQGGAVVKIILPLTQQKAGINNGS